MCFDTTVKIEKLPNHLNYKNIFIDNGDELFEVYTFKNCL